MSTKSLSPFILPACFSVIVVGALSTYWYLSAKPTKPPEPTTSLVKVAELEPPSDDTTEESHFTVAPDAAEDQTNDSLVTEEAVPSPPPAIALNDSDPEIAHDIQQLIPELEPKLNPNSGTNTNLLSWLSGDEFARKLVRAVYGSSLGNVVTQHRPVAPPKSGFSTVGLQERDADKVQKLYRMDTSNFSRYSRYIQTLSAVNGQTLVGLYQKYSPALEQAFLELGVQNTPGKDSTSSFHSTLLSAIDHMIAAPDVDDDVKLLRPSVMYRFQDPSLEKLSQAHKLMVRMGSDNRRQLKLELKKLKRNLQAIDK